MLLKPQDVLVVLHLAVLKRSSDARSAPVGFHELSKTLGLSLGAVHASFQRVRSAGLIASDDKKILVTDRLLPFLIHGIAVCFFPVRGQVTRGIPTGTFAPVFGGKAPVESDSVPVVWPHPEGTVRGETLQPLYKTVPRVALANRDLYDLLALIDVVRVGRPKDKATATVLLEKKLAV